MTQELSSSVAAVLRTTLVVCLHVWTLPGKYMTASQVSVGVCQLRSGPAGDAGCHPNVNKQSR